ncbi:hypothetical protein [Pseudacidovorax sp. RU35E]|uniref:hypothetical protein n=1 Tax=Pseudacidovorax sp. RU35E TaxID=1907403 RepID=UPI000954C7DA|nr:hypothetical protein [Pseudacidovorax sp. RU35E]SIR00795.1 hypothetical protein SAMN05880557_107106 [Pseudacidovorax sp. RU35E]
MSQSESRSSERAELLERAERLAAMDEVRRLYDPDDHPNSGRACDIAIGLVLMVIVLVTLLSVCALTARMWPWS